MRAGERTRTFTETGRRAQIVDAAIETIAELGYRKASFAQIAKHAGLSSTGLISYHFANKRELVEQIVEQVYGEIRGFLSDRLTDQPNASAALRAYIEGNIELSASRQRQMKALMDIFINGDLSYDADNDRGVVSPIEQILTWGQQTGEFRDFDVRVLATSIQRCVEGPAFILTGEPDLDLAAYTRELVTMFELATRANP